MSETLWRILSLPLRVESDLPVIRMRARDIAAILGFSEQDRARLAAAASEVARHALQHGGGRVDFQLEDAVPQRYWIEIVTGSEALGHAGHAEPEALSLAKGLVDHLEVEERAGRLHVRLGRQRPARSSRIDRDVLLRRVGRQLESSPAGDTASELTRQNRELVEALNALRSQSEVLAQANLELEETNRGVVALHAELDARAEMLSQTSELKSRLVSLVSHEFRTPLGSIRMLSELLLTDDAHPLATSHRAHVELIRRTATELAELVDDLLDLSKAQAGKLEVHPQDVRIDELFSSLRVLLRPLTNASEVDLRFELLETLPPMFTDAPKVSLILRNLISNALKFTPHGEVLVRAQSVGREEVCFQVIDTGIGIAAADLSRLFEDYSQIENPLQGDVKGTGLGLALVRRFSELLGGTVEVESALGRGSTFTVRLPRRWHEATGDPRMGAAAIDEARDASEVRTHPSARSSPTSPDLPGGPAPSVSPRDSEGRGEPAYPTTPGPGPRRVLVVDDDPAIRHLLVHHLEQLGCEALQASDGAEGLYLARKEQPQLMLLDLEMPALTGWEVMPQLRSEPRTRGLPVVIVSGRSRLEIERAGLDVQGILSKKEHASQLHRSLAELLERLVPLPEEAARV